MKRLILQGFMALFLMSGSAAAECLYQGFPYSEGARVCMYRTMYMCRGERWIKTAERCWQQYVTQAGPLWQTEQELYEGRPAVQPCADTLWPRRSRVAGCWH